MMYLCSVINNKSAGNTINTATKEMRTVVNEMSWREEEEVRNNFKEFLRESLNACNSVSDKFFYAGCEFDDYFQNLEEVYDEDGDHLGEGMSCFGFTLLVTEENKSKLEELFEQARNDVYEDYSSKVYEELRENTSYDDEDERSKDFDLWLEKGEINSSFLDAASGIRYYKMYKDENHTDVLCVSFDSETGFLQIF